MNAPHPPINYKLPYNFSMPNYRRLYGGIAYYFTVVTYNRLPILTGNQSRMALHDAWNIVEKRFPFRTNAICLLPDHIHAIWTLPEEDQNYSLRWKEIKRQFTKRYLLEIGDGEQRNLARQERGEAAIWQRRFWEHTIWNDDDLAKHVDYIHFNPVKHGLVKQVKDWRWSSFHRYVREGFYDLDWG